MITVACCQWETKYSHTHNLYSHWWLVLSDVSCLGMSRESQAQRTYLRGVRMFFCLYDEQGASLKGWFQPNLFDWLAATLLCAGRRGGESGPHLQHVRPTHAHEWRARGEQLHPAGSTGWGPHGEPHLSYFITSYLSVYLTLSLLPLFSLSLSLFVSHPLSETGSICDKPAPTPTLFSSSDVIWTLLRTAIYIADLVRCMMLILCNSHSCLIHDSLSHSLIFISPCRCMVLDLRQEPFSMWGKSCLTVHIKYFLTKGILTKAQTMGSRCWE